ELAHAWDLCSRAELALGHPKEALVALERAARVPGAATDARRLLALAQLRRDQGDAKGAVLALDEALKKNGRDVPALVERGETRRSSRTTGPSGTRAPTRARSSRSSGRASCSARRDRPASRPASSTRRRAARGGSSRSSGGGSPAPRRSSSTSRATTSTSRRA